MSTTVRVGLKFVKNLGNYESLHVDIGIEDSVRQGETASEATERVYKFVETKLMEKVKAITEELSD
jgi:hypothetical protein